MIEYVRGLAYNGQAVQGAKLLLAGEPSDLRDVRLHSGYIAVTRALALEEKVDLRCVPPLVRS